MRNIANLVAQLLLGNLSYIHSVDGNAALRNVIKTRNQVNEGGFARTGRADKGCGLSGFCRKGDMLENIRFCSVVAEGYILKLHQTFRLFHVFWCGRVFDGIFCGKHLIDTLGGNRCPWHHNKHHADEQKAHDDVHGILDKRHHIAHLQIALGNLFATKPDNQQ